MRKKIFTLFLALVASVGTLFAASGTCGENLTWDLTNGVLTISGTGAMNDYSYSVAPWHSSYYSITSVIINEGVTSIGEGAFYGCSSLTSVTIPNSVTSIGEGAFYGCSSLTSVTIPNRVTSIGNYAFYECSSLTSVTLLSNAIVRETYSIDFNMSTIFGSQVEEYIIGDHITSIGDWAFANCSGITSMTIPNNVTSIGEYAFAGCSGLTSMIIPDNVTSIREGAFAGCSGLTSVTIPNSVTSIGIEAFAECSSLTSITIPNSVTSIGEGVFYECNSLTSVTIPNSVTSIGIEAFSGCSSLTSVTIPNSVTSIGGQAFYNCSGLTSATIGNNVTSIGKDAFYKCTGLTSVHISDIVVWCGISFGNYAANPLRYAKHLYMSEEEISELIIPEGVSSINYFAFSGCTGLTSVTIPNSVTSIGSYAFYGCSSLTSVEIPNSITSIESYAFSGCSSLTSFEIPNNVTSIDFHAFSNCSSLTSVTIPNSITSIESYAFSGCSSLTSVEIPNSVTSIGNEAFYDCTGLTSVHITDIAAWCGISFDYEFANPLFYAHQLYVNGEEITEVIIPEGVSSINNYAFCACSLTSVTIPNSVTSIGKKAFGLCGSLTSVTIPNSVTSIGEFAFWLCSSLNSVTCYATTPPELGDRVFADIPEIPLYVLTGSVNKYKSVDQWKYFGSILPISAKDTETTNVETTSTENSVDVAWPAVIGAYTYVLVIRDKNGNVVCRMIFNAQGQLISIAFHAPSRDNVPQHTQTAGFSFTVTGLSAGTSYDLTITAKNGDGQVIEEQTISFTTEANIPTGIGDVQSDQVQSTKVLHNGQIYILRGNHTYDIQGKMVK